MAELHPLTKIISLIVLAICLQYVSLPQIFLLFGGLLLAVLHFHARYFLYMAKRVRWLVIIMLGTYAFSTPGEFIRQWPFDMVPTYEGLQSGILQALRLYTMLAGLTVLLASTSRNSLISGLYLLFQPLRLLGSQFDAERFAARLWLTLHYVENPVDNQKEHRLFERVSQLKLEGDVVSSELTTIHLEMPAMTWRDAAAMLLGLAGVFLLCELH